MKALSIAKREFSSYFDSPIAYVVLGVFLLVLGYLYFSTLFLAGSASMRNFFGVAPILFVVIGPALTMRLIAEERKSGTIEHLLTLPVTDIDVVAGKFLASLGIVMVGLLFTLAYPITVSFLTLEGARFDWGPVIGGYLGLLFLCSSFLAMGLFASTITRNQIVAFVLGLIFSFFFYFIDKFAVLLPAQYASFFEYLSVDFHFANISRGVIDSRDIVFYLSLTALGLASSVLTLRQQRN